MWGVLVWAKRLWISANATRYLTLKCVLTLKYDSHLRIDLTLNES